MAGDNENNDSRNADAGLRREIDMAAQASVATYVAGQIFGNSALPSWMPDFLKRKIEAEAETAQRNPDAGLMTIDSQLERNRKAREEREEQKIEQFRDQMEMYAEQQRREREEWARTYSTVGGVTMTGAQWADLARRLREDERFREQIIEAFKARGMTQDEAEDRADRAADVADAASVPPSQRTPEQRRAIAEADPQDLEMIDAVRKERKPSSSPTASKFNDVAEGAQMPTENQTQQPAAKAPQVAFVEGPGF